MQVDLLDDNSEAARPEVKASDELAGQVAALEGTDTKTLRDIWRKAWGRGAPKGARKRFLIFWNCLEMADRALRRV